MTLPALFPARRRPLGLDGRRQWRVYGAWMFAHDLLKQRPRTSVAFTNDLLPGAGL